MEWFTFKNVSTWYKSKVAACRPPPPMVTIRQPTANMAYEGMRVATIHQSSAAKAALLLHRARSRKKTARVSSIPHAMVTLMTRSPLGFPSSILATAVQYGGKMAMNGTEREGRGVKQGRGSNRGGGHFIEDPTGI